MLKPAYSYKDEINVQLEETYYDLKYMYYHYGVYRGPYEPSIDSDEKSDYSRRDFVSINKAGDIIGLITYEIKRVDDICYGFGAINFSDDSITFGRDLIQVIDDIFCKFNHRKISWNVVCGNPIEKSYDRYCKEYGGRIVGIHKEEVKLIDNKFYDDKVYELFRNDYLRGKEAVKSKLKLKDVDEALAEYYDEHEDYSLIKEETELEDGLHAMIDNVCVVIPELHMIAREAVILDDDGEPDYSVSMIFNEDEEFLLWESDSIIITLANMHIEDYTMDVLSVTKCYICKKEDLIK